jgi:hypothetical protein
MPDLMYYGVLNHKNHGAQQGASTNDYLRHVRCRPLVFLAGNLRFCPCFLRLNQAVAIDADDRGSADQNLTILVLMAVDDQFRLGPVNVVGQRVEALVDAVLAVVDAARGVVGEEDVHRRKVRQEPVCLGLVVEEGAA